MFALKSNRSGDIIASSVRCISNKCISILLNYRKLVSSGNLIIGTHRERDSTYRTQRIQGLVVEAGDTGEPPLVHCNNRQKWI